MFIVFQVVNTPMVLGKFTHLKYLEIVLIKPNQSPDYDFCSLVSFLDGAPSLETFILRVSHYPLEAINRQNNCCPWELKKINLTQ